MKKLNLHLKKAKVSLHPESFNSENFRVTVVRYLIQLYSKKFISHMSSTNLSGFLISQVLWLCKEVMGWEILAIHTCIMVATVVLQTFMNQKVFLKLMMLRYVFESSAWRYMRFVLATVNSLTRARVNFQSLPDYWIGYFCGTFLVKSFWIVSFGVISFVSDEY